MTPPERSSRHLWTLAPALCLLQAVLLWTKGLPPASLVWLLSTPILAANLLWSAHKLHQLPAQRRAHTEVVLSVRLTATLGAFVVTGMATAASLTLGIRPAILLPAAGAALTACVGVWLLPTT